MDDLIKRIRIDAFAHCAWADAADPTHGANLRAMFGGGDAITFEQVKDRLGDKAAEAWQQGVDARQKFFEAVKDGQQKTS